MKVIIFDYLYRDASNWKEWGEATFTNPDGYSLFEIDQRIKRALHEGQWFIAEQAGVEPVYIWNHAQVCEDDHCWHEYHGVREMELTNVRKSWQPIIKFIQRLESIGPKGWKEFDVQQV